MKKCMLCGTEEADEKRFTCRACGEATWSNSRPGDPQYLVVEEKSAEPSEPEMIAITSEMNGDVVEVPFGNAKKRGPGRPRKTQ